MGNPRPYPPKLFIKRWEGFSGPLIDGPYADDAKLVDACIAQEAALMDFAQQKPFPIERLVELRFGRAAGGAEHEVFIPKKKRSGSRVWKITRNGRWGLKRATPLEYLRRLDRFDRFSGTKIRVEGIAVEDNTPTLVTTMDFILGVHPENLHERLLNEGWIVTPDPDQMLSYKHKAYGIVMRDAHAKNFILTAANRLVPIDVIIS